VGTVVTINGTGFTGINQAWVGAAHNASVTVISDSQVKVTIPSGATTGAIGILNSQHASFTPTSFTVVASVPDYVQPMIQNFSPATGKAGTVVTINGTGFTGINQAWVGTAHNATVTVVSDTQVRVTIPYGATTGAIGILNPKHASFTATSFIMR
jgi:predicted alpha/beta superfamily hydrolase